MTSYRLPVLDATGGEPVRTLPGRYVIARQGTYVHRPRSAARFTHPIDKQKSWVSVQLLCGQHVSSPIITDEIPGPLCGTCFGRDLGYDLDRPDIIWQPRGLYKLPKRWCPGPDLGLWADISRNEPGHRSDALCLFCGTYGKARGMGRMPYAATYSMVKHQHNGCGRACPSHGWKFLRSEKVDDDHVRIWCTGGYGYQGCDKRPRPFWLIVPHGKPPPPAHAVEGRPFDWDRDADGDLGQEIELTDIEKQILGAYGHVHVPVRRRTPPPTL